MENKLKLRKEGKQLLLFNREAARTLEVTLDRAMTAMTALVETVKTNGQNADRETLEAVLFGNGGEFILTRKEKEVRDWLASSPFGYRQKERLVDEALSEFPAEMVKDLDKAKRTVWDEFAAVPVPPVKEDFNVTDGKIELLPSYGERAQKWVTRTVTEAEKELLGKIRELSKLTESLEAQGLAVLGSMYYYPDRDGNTRTGYFSGILDLLKRDGWKEENLDDETLLNLMSDHKRAESC